MKYTHFETLAIVLGSLAIVGSVFMAPSSTPQSAEVAAQLLIILVFGAALHWGRNGGFLAALLALALYTAMRFPLLQEQGLSSEMLTMLGTRSVTYALVGIVGGEVASRIKYVFARLENDSLIDAVSGVYSARYAADSILSGLGQWDRYRTEFSVVRLTTEAEVLSGLKPARYRQLMRQAAGHLRGDIRMVDDLAFQAPSTFLVLLPGTPRAGANVVADRLAPLLRSAFDASADHVTIAVHSAATDAGTLRQLAETLAPATPEPTQGTLLQERRRVSDTPQDPVA